MGEGGGGVRERRGWVRMGWGCWRDGRGREKWGGKGGEGRVRRAGEMGCGVGGEVGGRGGGVMRCYAEVVGGYWESVRRSWGGKTGWGEGRVGKGEGG